VTSFINILPILFISEGCALSLPVIESIIDLDNTPTVSTHVRNMLTKIGCANRTEAAAYAMRHGCSGV
jgi:hypothetical protein